MAYWYIGTLEECLAYNDKVNDARGYEEGNVTSNWSEPRAHPEDDYYAIISNYNPLFREGIEPDEESSLFLVADLGDDWFEWFYEEEI